MSHSVNKYTVALFLFLTLTDYERGDLPLDSNIRKKKSTEFSDITTSMTGVQAVDVAVYRKTQAKFPGIELALQKDSRGITL